jgi:hypothetical protein
VFRKKIDAFFADPRVGSLRRRTPVPGPQAPTTAGAALRSSLDDVLTRLGSAPDGFRLDRSIVTHDGELVSVTGNAGPMPPDDQIRVVTTTTTVVERGRMRTETSVLVFAAGPDR